METVHDVREVDEKGRYVDINQMTTDEKLDELVKVSRVLTDKVEEFLEQLPNNPMFKMLGRFL